LKDFQGILNARRDNIKYSTKNRTQYGKNKKLTNGA